jgi:hypothetical protein
MNFSNSPLIYQRLAQHSLVTHDITIGVGKIQSGETAEICYIKF